jgi:capsular polysaccharide biosynthesis protein
LEISANSFVLNRKLSSGKYRIADSAYAYISCNLIELIIKPSWPHVSRNNFQKQIKETSITAKNILILNLNNATAYGHIYSEVFSELCAVDEIYPEYDYILTVKTPLMEKIIDFFNLKLSNKIRFVHNRSDEHYLLNFEHLHVVNHCPLSYINKSKNVATLKSIFHKLTPIRNRSQNFLIFCSRRSFSAKNGRNITEENENEIIEYLKQYSVQNNLEFYLLTGEEPDGSTVSIEKQYELFTNAEIVVGLHGGVMNNLIFLDPAKKPKVIEFCPSESKNFSRLFDGAIDVFAKYYKIPYIIPIEAQKEIADESVESLKTAKIISILQKINCSIDVSELKKILLTLNKKLILD